MNKNQLHKLGKEIVELKNRGIDAQLISPPVALDHIRISTPRSEAIITVKTKQGSEWPACKGVYGSNRFLVLVDFNSKDLDERPDFYILNGLDFGEIVQTSVSEIKRRKPDKQIIINEQNTIVFLDEYCQNGRPYEGHALQLNHVRPFLGKWEKIEDLIRAQR